MSLLAEKPVVNKILARQRLMMQMAATQVVNQKLLTGEFELRDGKITKGKTSLSPTIRNFTANAKPAGKTPCCRQRQR
ncbi:TPA: hypothetical protein ACSTL0_005184 [Serratia fonticola]